MVSNDWAKLLIQFSIKRNGNLEGLRLNHFNQISHHLGSTERGDRSVANLGRLGLDPDSAQRLPIVNGVRGLRPTWDDHFSDGVR
jgi:hypothetical protein